MIRRVYVPHAMFGRRKQAVEKVRTQMEADGYTGLKLVGQGVHDQTFRYMDFECEPPPRRPLVEINEKHLYNPPAKEPKHFRLVREVR